MAESKEGETGSTIFFEGEEAQKVLSEIFSSPLNDHPQNSTK